MKRTLLFYAPALLFASTCAWGGAIYKCKDAAGGTLYQQEPCAKGTQPVSSWAPTGRDADAASGRALIIGQGNGGHYFIDGSVNDAYQHFVIDTGATVVALPLAAAANAGVKCGAKAFVQTGNGIAQVCTATIEKLTFGKFTLHDVQAMIAPNLTQPLLGMNVLRQFQIEQDNGQLRLVRKY